MSQVNWTDPYIARIVHTVCARFGLFFRESQRDTVELGIREAMKQAGYSEPADYLHYIEQNRTAFDQLMIELTVNETYFFRDVAQMNFIRREILPEIVARRELSHEIRLWSAGCASGEEPYSLAMLLTEAGLIERTRILATDISRRSLERAQKARYREWSLRGEGAALARKFLHRREDSHELDAKIRRHVQFEYLNLALDVYPSNVTGTRDLDLILCRNVLIYFDSDTIATVARRFFESLTPGGWIVTAAGDPPLDRFADLETIVTDSGLYYRRGTAGCSETTDFVPPSATDTVPDTAFQQSVPAKSVVQRQPETAAVSIPTPLVVSPSAAGLPIPRPPTLASARQALAAGDYRVAAEITAQLPETPELAAVRVQSLANFDLNQAEQICAAAAQRHGLSAQLQYLHAVLLLDLNREYEAAQAARRAVYLDNSLTIAHFTLGSILRRLGDVDAARRSFRNTRDLCADRPADEVVRYSDGEHAGTLARAAHLQLEGLDR